MSKGPDTFFSYSREDSDFVVRLAQDLRAAGAAVWLDQLDIHAGDRWDRSVGEALERCRRLIVILSPASVASDNVLDEVSNALNERKTIIPVLYRDCKVPYRLERLEYVDCRAHRDYAAVVERLRQTLAGTEGAAAGAPPPVARRTRGKAVYALIAAGVLAAGLGVWGYGRRAAQPAATPAAQPQPAAPAPAPSAAPAAQQPAVRPAAAPAPAAPPAGETMAAWKQAGTAVTGDIQMGPAHLIAGGRTFALTPVRQFDPDEVKQAGQMVHMGKPGSARLYATTIPAINGQAMCGGGGAKWLLVVHGKNRAKREMVLAFYGGNAQPAVAADPCRSVLYRPQ